MGDERNPAPKLTPTEAYRLIGERFGLDPDVLITYAQEDDIGGFYFQDLQLPTPYWPTGSLWHVEGQILYALVRATQPDYVVEVGSYKGCSISHIASALRKNGRGVVVSVDPVSDFSQVAGELFPYIDQRLNWYQDFIPERQIDFLFEDGAHSEGFTEGVFNHFRPYFKDGMIAACHDYYHFLAGPFVAPGFHKVFGDKAFGVLVEPANCGLGLARV